MKRKLKKNAQMLFTALLCLISFSLTAQRTITGVVTDNETGEELIGANILLVGTNVGTISDYDGSYSLEIPDGTENPQLELSYVGYETQVINVGASNILDIKLGSGELLDEVVIVGYGTVRKGDKTGAITAVSSDDFNGGAISSPEQLITGKVAGVQITPSSGAPGGQSSIRIRGGTSLNASNDPLFVVDGVPLDNSAFNPTGFSQGSNPLNFIAPEDIESFTVLKDASATAIYGSRGANGVIIITTKKGSKGENGKITYNGYFKTSQLASDPLNLTASQFRSVVTNQNPSSISALGNANTNWFDEVTRTGVGQNHNLGYSNGNENSSIRLSVGYLDLEGILLGSKTTRTSYNLNLSQNFFDKRLKINSSIKGAYTTDDFAPDVVGNTWSFDPTQAILNPDDDTYAGYFEYNNSLAPRNPVSTINQIDETGTGSRNIGNIDFTYSFNNSIPGLSTKLLLGFDLNQGERKRYSPTTYTSTARGAAFDGEARIENFKRLSKLMEATATYQKTFGGKHDINLLAGYSYQDWNSEFPSLIARDFSSDIFGINSLTQAEEYIANNSTLENRLISFFGRANYQFDNKYLVTATLRRDGSTRFGPDNRWGLFPSFAIGWRVLQEDFAANLSDVFSELKLRAGYGVVGSQEIGDYRYLATYSLSDQMSSFPFNGQNDFTTVARADAYDPGLKWEETSSYNIGLDYGFLNGRISGNIEYYYKKTEDLLLEVDIPSGTNLSDRVLTNVGSIENSGVEFTVNAVPFDKKDFSWNIGVNAAFNNNKVLAIDAIEGTSTIARGGVGFDNVQALSVGQPVDAYLLYEHKRNADGSVVSELGSDDTANDLAMFVDQNGDGIINQDDKVFSENPAPDVILGLSTNVRYKNLDLSMTVRSNVGNYVYNNNAASGGYYDLITARNGFINNLHQSVLETNFQNRQTLSDYYLEDGSFVKIDNISLGYNVTQIKNFNARIYVTAENPLVLTKYSGLDPEVENSNNRRGIDDNPYPRSRTFVLGLNLTF